MAPSSPAPAEPVGTQPARRTHASLISWIVVFLLSTPIGCGKSEGGNGESDRVVRTSYEGSVKPARLDVVNAVALSTAVAETVSWVTNEHDPPYEPRIISNDQQLLINHLRPLELFGNTARPDIPGREIDEEQDCPRGGRVEFTGTEFNTTTGKIRARYRNCRENDLRYRGSIETDRVRVRGDLFVSEETVTFESFEVKQLQEGGRSLIVDGTIAVTRDGYGEEVESTVEALYVGDRARSRDYLLENMLQRVRLGGEYTARWLEGRVFEGVYGWVDFRLVQQPGGKLVLQLFDTYGGRLHVEANADANLLELDINGDELVDGTLNWLFATSGPLPAENVPPVAHAGSDLDVVGASPVTLDAIRSSDANLDLLTYRWRITSSPAGARATLSNPHARQTQIIVDSAGVYEVELVASDGRLVSAADRMKLTASARPLEERTKIEAPVFATPGELWTASVNPGLRTDGPPLHFELLHGPPGMEITPDGAIHWTPPSTQYTNQLEFDYSVKTEEGAVTAVQEMTVTVFDPDRPSMLARRPRTAGTRLWHDIFLEDLDSDGDEEILVLAGGKLVYELDWDGSDFVMVWLNPFPLDENDIASLAAFDIDGDGKLEIFVAHGPSVSILDGRTRQPIDRLEVADGNIGTVLVADLDFDGTAEIVLQTYHDESPRRRLTIYDVATRDYEWSFGEDGFWGGVVARNVDRDPALELITGEGSIVDGHSQLRQLKLDSLEQVVVTGDANHDGIDDILSASGVFDIANEQVIWDQTFSLYRGGAILDYNGDGLNDLLIARSGESHVYLANGSNEWLYSETIEEGMPGVLVGDPDGDNVTELVYVHVTYGFAGVKTRELDRDDWTAPEKEALYDGFTGGRSSTIRNGESVVSFGANHDDGARLVEISRESGETWISDSRLPEFETLGDFLEFDKDLDGLPEIALDQSFVDPRGVSLWDGGDAPSYRPNQTAPYSELWTIANISGDVAPELIARRDDSVWSWDFSAGQERQLGISVPSYYISDIALSDLRGDGVVDMVVAERSGLYIYEDIAGEATPGRPTYLYMDSFQVEVFDFDRDGTSEILVMDSEYVGSTRVWRIRIFDPDLQLLNEFSLGEDFTYIVVDDGGEEGLVLLTASNRLEAINPLTGERLWRSPALHGEVRGGLHLHEDAAGSPFLSFVAGDIMYITR